MASKTTNDERAAFFDALVRCETRLYNELSDRLRTEHGIVATQFEFLKYFRDHPSSRIADVATNFAAGIGAISKGVDRLEARGLVVRHPNPADGRSNLVSLTSAGAELVAQAETTFHDSLAELMAALGAEQIATAYQTLATLRTVLEKERRGVPIG